MLSVRNLTVFQNNDLRTIVKDLSFTLGNGDKTVVIGEEGNGKSTLLKLIYDPRLVESYAEHTGTIDRGGARMGYLAQELTEYENRLSVYEFMCLNETFCSAAPPELARACKRVGIQPELLYSDRRIGSFSGGERVKLRLAGLLLSDPDIYLLDEPSNDLDIDALVRLERFINTCGRPVLFVSHDETLIENTATSVIHIERLNKKRDPRHTVSSLDYVTYMAERAARFEREDRLAFEQERAFNKKMEKFRQIKNKVENQQSSISRGDPHGGRLLKKKMHSVLSTEKRFQKEKEAMTKHPKSEEHILARFEEDVSIPEGKTVVELKPFCLKIGERILSREVALTVRGPRKVCIVGKNGCGKTTLIKHIYGEIGDRGDIRVGYMPQNYGDLLPPDLTPVDFLCPDGDSDARGRVRTFLGSMRYTAEEMLRPIKGLSGGQKAKLFLLRMILCSCNCLLLDEPTRNFSPLSNPVVRDVLKSFGGCVISVSHDRKFINEVCDTVLVLDEGGLKPYTA